MTQIDVEKNNFYLNLFRFSLKYFLREILFFFFFSPLNKKRTKARMNVKKIKVEKENKSFLSQSSTRI